MTSLTLHLIVITLLAAAAITAAAEGAATRSPVQRGRGAAGGASAATTTSTQAPTLRAPRQRRPPTTLPIDDGNGRRGSTTTPLPATQRQQRRRFTATTTTTTATATTTTTTVAPASAGSYVRTSGSSRGSIRAARQPRDTPTPTLGERESSAGSDGSARNQRLQSHHTLSSASSSNPLAVFNASSRSGALKTPRMIQRLVAGHIHNAQGHSTYEVSAVSANSSRSIGIATTTPSTTTTTTTAKSPSTRTTRRKASSTYRLARPSPSPSPVPAPERDQDDDEALLNEPDDFDNWDNGILRLSAGSGKEEAAAEAASAKGQSKQSKEDAKKTLADQVRDGKYGLIEKELFRRVPKRPGVLSYARNSEVPLDNERNFGGLSEQDIWLAEDHLLVIKGGGLNEAEGDGDGADAWPAIDDYDAPPRQIKLPAHPVVPPPFPVQLEPHGPLQLIRDNQIEGFHTTAGNATLSAVGQHASHGQVHGAAHGPGSHPAARTGAIASAKAADPEPSYVYPTPYAPWLLSNNETPAHTPASPAPNAVLRTPLLGPWIINGLHGNGNASGPGALHGNISDFDEDDPSLYYPPAYNFVYRSNYSNPVPPGPLVPGIVLPPPPDHFSLLETTTSTTTRRPFTTPTSSTTTTTTSTSSSTTTTTTSTTSTRAPASRLSIKYNSIGYLPPAPRQPNKYVERVPVPVAVPIPIYPVNYQPTTPRPQPAAQLVFVPSLSSTERSLSAGERDRERERGRERERERGRDRDREQAPLSKSNPIYYEYFEAKRQPSSLKSNVINDFLGTKPPKRPHYKSPPSPVNDVAVVSITPKPRVQLHSEYDAALGQLIRSNLIAPPATGRFQPPDFDRQPFLPMVNYSADEHDQNAFKAIVYQPQTQQQPQQQLQLQRQRQLRVGKHQQLQLQLEPTLQPAQDQDSYLPDSLLLQRQRQLRVGKQQLQLQLQSPSPAPGPGPGPGPGPYDSQQGVYSTPLPPTYLENQLQPRPAKYQLRPPAPAPLQFWQRPAAPPPPVPPPAPQFKRLRHGSAKHSYPPYFVPSYPSGPAPEPLYRLLPVQQHKHWRQSNKQQQQQQQQIQVQPQPQQQYYPDRGVNIGHSLASDILVNYNSNNQFNPQAELVPQAQLGPPPLSYQAQNGGQASLWSDRPVRQSRAQLQEQA
ncbi:mucin-5AC [Drosophila virilis]|uniref:Uncharacterized protein n=1 Tax=Drosophila virilis TaxID=7244 RepID=B4M1M4_DROVI|nr:hormone receptor 4 [Drosophila virilis]EDW65578.2 uncharacterized protein Dvir_GJ19335 [Drosophila virilis]